jgi:hypothetical protein
VGEFYLSCSQHEGTSDVHAADVTATRAGSAISHAAHGGIFLAGLALIVCAAGFVTLYYFLSRKRL